MPSQDPRQQELRNRKKVWNGAYKHFSQGLKAFKDSLNGKGKIPGKIQDAPPAQLGSMLDSLSQEFEQLVSGAHEVFDDQSNYSKTRRKKKPKQLQQQLPTQQEATAPNDKVVQQLSQLGSTETFELEALATNRLSRSWQYFKGMFYRKEVEKQRVSLLRMCADLFWSLRDLQNETLTLNIDNTPNLVQSFQASRYTFSSVHKTIDRLEEIIAREEHKKQEQKKKELLDQVDNKNTSEQSAEHPPAEEPAAQQSSAHSSPMSQTATPASRPTARTIVDKIMIETNKLLQAGFGKPQAQQIAKLYEQFMSAKNDQEKLSIRDGMQELYKEMNEVMAGRKPTAEAHNDTFEITKEGHNALTRFLKRQLAKMQPGNETASLRLDISNSIDEAEDVLKKMMDGLHKEVSMKNLQESIEKLKTILANIGHPLNIILQMYERDIYKDPKKRQKLKGRDQSVTGDPTMDMVMRRRIRNDLSRGILDRPKAKAIK